MAGNTTRSALVMVTSGIAPSWRTWRDSELGDELAHPELGLPRLTAGIEEALHGGPCPRIAERLLEEEGLLEEAIAQREVVGVGDRALRSCDRLGREARDPTGQCVDVRSQFG